MFLLHDSTREEAMCQKLLAYSLIATTPKAIQIAVPLLGACPHSPQSVLLFLEALFMQPEGQGLKEQPGKEEAWGETGAENWKDVIKENKEVTVESGSFTQEPILLLFLTSDPIFSPVFRHSCQKERLSLMAFGNCVSH